MTFRQLKKRSAMILSKETNSCSAFIGLRKSFQHPEDNFRVKTTVSFQKAFQCFKVLKEVEGKRYNERETIKERGKLKCI